MCGIAGFTTLSPMKEAPLRLHAMVDSLVHRGPDTGAVFESELIHLGHRRLSILDLSDAAAQPMEDLTERYVLIFNGEIYNYREIKSRIQGYPFQGNGDTEVILAAYIKWGADCLQYFNGMFSLAIWDNQDKTLFIARDRLGIKPLYYYYNGQDLIFASEIRALLKSGRIPSELNAHSLGEYLQYYSVNSPNTLIKDVYQIKAGHYAIWFRGSFVQKPYWSPVPEKIQEGLTTEEVQKEIRNKLTLAVERRMVSDVPLGAFLSGGIDSSAIVALMASVSEQPVHTFSVIFDEKEYDESQYSYMIAKKYNTSHHPIKLRPSHFLEELPKALEAMDHPSGDGINSYVVSQATRNEGFTVALSGLGGDELFAGYPIFNQYARLNRLKAFYSIPLILRKWAGKFGMRMLPKHKRARLYQLMAIPSLSFEDTYPVFRQIFSSAEIEELTGISPSQSILSPILDEDELKALPGLPVYSQVSIGEISTYTQNVLLRDTDQMSMAHSLEVRVPFFDHELVEYLLSIPDVHKHPSYPKKLLVDAMGDLLPKEIVFRKKMGFVFPWALWMRNELLDLCEGSIQSLASRGLFRAEVVLDYWKRFKAGDPEMIWMKLWMLVMLEQWIQKNEL